MDKQAESGELHIVDLGAASVETKGPPGFPAETIGQRLPVGIDPGLT